MKLEKRWSMQNEREAMGVDVTDIVYTYMKYKR